MKGICRDCYLEKHIPRDKSGCCQDCWDFRLDLITRLHEGDSLKLLQAELAAKKRDARREEAQRFWNPLSSISHRS